MRREDFHEIASTLKEVTHITAFIGLPDGINLPSFSLSFDAVNEALIRFALNELPKLEFICFRRDVNDICKELLNKSGFEMNPDRSFTLKLRGSSVTSFILISDFFHR